ncbi:TniQ family protein [Streptomyces sp. ML-6]|uniref:TniQ family protein n=1 Tax=Streptomyces sp. ML-6 TaxID=2982693 RepID=UPI0024C0BD80|nr:TniQ family protein [Streptomyces sp. ML-6]MDK0524806.1 TniQ family protein [Streptomyces sp. ML-6]
MTAPRVLPLRVTPLPGESLDSWLEALGRRSGLPLAALLTILGLPRVFTTRLLVTSLEPHVLRNLEHLTGLPERRLDAMVFGPGMPWGPQRQPRCRFCPQCLAEREGRWLLRWWLPWVFACTTHQVLLHDLCPRCQSAPRRHLPRQNHRQPPATCLRKPLSEPACGTDLTTAPALALPASHELLETQRWIDSLLNQTDLSEAHTVFSDLDACTGWLQRAVQAADLKPLGDLVVDGWAEQPQPSRQSRLMALSPTVRGVIAHTARPILAGTDTEAIDAIRELRQREDPTGSPTPHGMDFHPWRRLSTAAHRRFLQAADPQMRVLDRLRLRSATPRAGYPSAEATQSTDRIRHVPQVLWPAWTVRLMPHEGTAEDYFRAMACALLLLPGEPQRTPREITDRLHPYLSDSMAFVLRQITHAHPDVMVALCRLADHLDEHGSTIDYQRRRDLIPDEPISYEEWKQLCFATGTQPGESLHRATQTPRFVQVQRYLHQMLTGSDLTYPAHPLAWQNARDRSRFLAFLPTLTLDQRHALHSHARNLLEQLGIDEPLTWEPPEECAAGLSLPGRPLRDIDLDVLKHIVLIEQRAPSEAARELSTTITHVRFALEHLGAEPQEWTSRHSPLAAWRLRERARTVLTPEFLEREYTQREKTLTQIAQETDLPRHIVVEQANAIGLTIYRSRRPHPIDEDWLREQYLTHKRSTYDIAQAIGTEDETIRRRLQRLGIPLRPRGVHSRTVMTAKLAPSIPLDVRAAVEGTLHGWLRLHRFQIAMAFPNLTTAGTYLGAMQTALTTQFQRLENDIGHVLYQRSVQTTPQHPTTHGQSLLRHLDQPDIRKLMHNALTPNEIHPLPDETVLAEATATFRQRRPPGPLKPFDSIGVQRIRVRQETLTLLHHLLHHADKEFYGAQVHARTGLAQGSVSDQLRRLRQAGWLTSRPEDDNSWMRRATPGRGPGRRITYYSLTPEGRRAAAHELHTRGIPASRNSTERWDETVDKTSRQPTNAAGQKNSD